MSVSRRTVLGAAAGALAAGAARAGGQTLPATTRGAGGGGGAGGGVPASVRWTPVPREAVWGLRWGADEAPADAPYSRLPARAKGVVRDAVWDLARDTAGLGVRLNVRGMRGGGGRSGGGGVWVRYALMRENLAMSHMPATGVSGMDGYVRVRGRDGVTGGQNDTGAARPGVTREDVLKRRAAEASGDSGWKFWGVVQPRAREVAAKVGDVPAGVEEVLLNFPLYSAPGRVEVGVDGGEVEFVPRPASGGVVWYGTSITQGGCASRPGMAFTSILSRRLGVEVVNFGFSGNGTTEVEVAGFLAEIDAKAFVIDTMANTKAEDLEERTVAVVRLLRERRPGARVALLEQRRWATAGLRPDLAASHEAKVGAFKRAYERVKGEGIAYWDGAGLIGDDGEGTVDGSHPNDLGMMRYADALEGRVRGICDL